MKQRLPSESESAVSCPGRFVEYFEQTEARGGSGKIQPPEGP